MPRQSPKQNDRRSEILIAAGWNLHHKEGDKVFWESPYEERRIFLTSHALLVEEQEAHNRKIEKEAYHLQRLEDWDWDDPAYDVDKVFPPVKREKIKRPRSKKAKAKAIKELGF